MTESFGHDFDRCPRVAGRVSVPVLLQAEAHFGSYESPPALRVFMPKGHTAKMWAARPVSKPIEAPVAATVRAVLHSALREQFASRAPLGRTFVDPALQRFTVPLTMRSASKSLRTVGRGSRLPIPDSNVVRLFLWWRNGRDRTDIDLSAAAFDRDFRYIDVLSYYSLKAWGGLHSGDIVDAPQGAAEFIDIDIARMRERGARYVVASLHSFTNQPYCDLPECFAGWMARSRPGSDEAFEPLTVVDRIDLTSDTRISLPFIFDLDHREAIWSDLALRRHPSYQTNVAQTLTGMTMMLQAMVALRRPTIYTLARLHAESRGVLVAYQATADTVFAVTTGITPFDTDTIRTELL